MNVEYLYYKNMLNIRCEKYLINDNSFYEIEQFFSNLLYFLIVRTMSNEPFSAKLPYRPHTWKFFGPQF